jgi:cell shape-determining protein MreD
MVHFLLHVGFGFGHGAPDLLTVALLLAAREIGLGRAAALGFFFGLLEDALSVLTFGANGVAMTLVGIGGAITRDFFVGDSRVFVVSYLLVGKWMRDLVHWLMVGEGLRQSFVDQVLVLGGLGALYASAIGIVLMTITGLAREQ